MGFSRNSTVGLISYFSPWKNPPLCGFFTLMTSLLDLPASAFIGMINHCLKSESWAREELIKHQLKIIATEIPLGRFVFQITENGYLKGFSGRLGEELGTPSEPNLSLVISAQAFNQLITSVGKGREEALRAVKISGDADLAQLLSKLAGQLRWEYEEDLSKLIGDASAHFLVKKATQFYQAGQSALQDFQQNTLEYLTEEKNILLQQDDFLRHKRELNDLRDSVERLAKRIDQLGIKGNLS